jgi:hypothetical protein
VEIDLAEKKQRQDNLEAQVDALESRIDWQEGMLKLVGAGIGTTRSGAANEQAAAGETGDKRPGVQDVEALLHSIVRKQSSHSTTLRMLEKAQGSGQSRLQAGIDGLANRLDSIANSLRRIEGGRHDR